MGESRLSVGGSPTTAVPRTLSHGLVLGLVVFAVSYGSLALTASSGHIAALWPTNAVILAAYLRCQVSERWWLLLAAWLATGLAGVYAGDAISSSFALGLTNIVQVMLGGAIYLRLRRADTWSFGDGWSLIVFGASCCLLGPAIGAALACTYLAIVAQVKVLAVWPVWFLSDALGMIAIAPFLLSIDGAEMRRLLVGRKVAEAVLILSLAAVTALVAFWQQTYPVAFLIFPVMLLAAFRLGFSGTACVSTVISLIAIILTLQQRGPFMLLGDDDLHERILFLQFFVLVAVLTALPVAAALAERQRSVAQQARSSRFHAAILNSTDYSVIATDEQGVITHFNAGAEKMLGYGAVEMIGRQTPEVIHLPAEVAARAAELSIERGRQIAPGFEAFVANTDRGTDEREWTYVRKDGSHLPVDLSVTALHDETGEVVGYLGIGKDLTRQRELSTMLEQSRQDLLRMIDNIPAMVAYWDSDLRNRFANAAYRHWFGVVPNPGDHIRDVLGPKLFEANRPFMEAALRGEAQRFERMIPSPSGSTRYSQAHYLLDFRDGKVIGFYVLVFDISELKQTAEALEHAKEAAEEATRAKSTFLTSMSHELRTPMNGVLGFVDLLLSQTFGTLNPKQLEFTTLVKRSAEHLMSLISDVLELSKIESGRVTLSIEAIDVRPLVKSVIATVQTLAEKRSIILTERYLIADDIGVLADQTRLAPVLLNLVSNAIKYNRPGGWVEISCARQGDGFVRLKVTDNGLGIAAARQDEVFQPFNRLGAEQGIIEGTGIGLALAKNLVEMMGGEIGFTSVEWKGSTFWVDLPVAKARRIEVSSAGDAVAPPAVPVLSAPLRVLYIEDNENGRLLFRHYMALVAGISLVEASDGLTGLSLAQSERPDIIFLDINLPQADGYQVLRELRKTPALAHIPVIAVSANAMAVEIEHALAVGFYRYLTKPLRLAEIMELLRDLDQHRSADASASLP
jgi:PAS domain S-box-containing protein